MNFDKTTNLSVLRTRPSLFTWGEIVAFHDLGPYTIAEFKPTSDLPKREGTEFHVWVDGKDIHHGAKSLEEAILLAIGFRNLGMHIGPNMARAALKVLT